MRARFRTLGALAWLAAVATLASAAAFPQHTGYVNDFAHLLAPAADAALEERLRAAERETGAEIAVATVSSLDGMSVEEYSNRLFAAWGIGKKGVDNGVLVLVAPNEREMRIEVGYGLEGVLPDGLAGQIIRASFLPHFRNDDYAAGIEEGVARVVEVVTRNHVLTDEERAALEQSNEERAPAYITIPFFSVFILVGFFLLGAGLGSKTGFPVLFGGLFGGMPLLMTLFPALNVPIYVTVPLVLGAAAIGFRNGRRRPDWIKAMRAGSRNSRSDDAGWVMGRGSDSSSGSSRSGSSGGSFGGGSSGGGGASGRW